MTGTLHLITGEFPPDVGGVGDYCAGVARGLAATGLDVHVWCTTGGEPSGIEGAAVHRVAAWTGRHLRDVGRAMDAIDASAPMLVQWVPHAYGRRSLNLAFCRWVRRRARSGQPVDLMVHEPFLAFREGSWKQDAAASVHRVMIWLLLDAARRVWISTPAWSDRLRPWTFRRAVPFEWLPVPNSIPVVRDAAAVMERRRGLAAGASTIVGHFGSYNRLGRQVLLERLPAILERFPDATAVLLGRGSEEFAAEVRTRSPRLAQRLVATGVLPAREVSVHLQACDVLLQPYVDGVTTRRTTVMAGLAHAIPIVTTSGRDTEPIWRESGAVELAPSADPEGFVRCALALVGDRPRRERLADAGRSLYDAHFALDRTIETLRLAAVADAAAAAA